MLKKTYKNFLHKEKLNTKQRKHSIICLLKIIEIVGTRKKVADELKLCRQNITGWISGKVNIPTIHIPRLVKLSKGTIQPSDLRPDCYE